MSEKLAANVVTQEQWDDVSKRLERKWIYSLWNNSERCISLDDLTNGTKKFYIDDDYKIISYEEFIKDRIDSIEDIERLWKEERLDKIVVNGGSVHNMPYFDLDNEKGHINHYEIHVGFKNINLKETQKLIKKEKKMLNCKVKIVEKFKNVYSLSKGEVYEFKNGKLKHNTIDNSYNQTYLTKEEFENQIKERYKIEWIEGEKEMTKSDLKTGMILKLRNKNLGMVLLNTPNGDIISGNAWCGLENYRENLTHINDPFYDIVEIFEPTTNMGYLNRGVNIKYDKKSIWKRQEKSPLQLKLEELEAKSLKISKKQQEITKEIARIRGEM